MSVQQGIIQGKDTILLLQKNGVYIPFVCSKQVAISINADKLSVKTVGDGVWKKYSYQALGYSITLSGVMKFDSDNFTGWDFIDDMLQFLPVNFKLIFTDIRTGTAKRLVGQVLIETSTLTATPIDVVVNDLSLPGNGPLLIQNPADDCNITIISGTFFQTGTTGRYRVTGHSGAAIVRVDYDIDGGAPLSAFPTTFIFDLPLTGLTAGAHTIHITPFCANGFAGTTYAANFNALAVYAILGRVEISPSTICGGSVTPLFRDNIGGSILYTDEALTTPITGSNIVILDDNILHLDTVTGTIGSFIDTCGSSIQSSWYRLSNSSGTVCAAAFVRLYSSTVFGTGQILYTDAGLTTPVTGFTFVDKNTNIFGLNTSTGVVGSFVGNCPGESQKNDYILGNIPSICASPELTYYMAAAFAIGGTIYTNSSLTTPLAGKDKFALSSNGHIYNVNTGSGVVISDSGATCTTGIPVNVILGNNSATICGNSGVVLYVAVSFAPGHILYTDAGLTTPQTGDAFVVNADDPTTPIYALNTSTGVIGAATGLLCGTPVSYDLIINKVNDGDIVGVDVTDESTSATTTYSFSDSEPAPTKTFTGVLTGGITYTIHVTFIGAIVFAVPISITGGDGTVTSTSLGVALTAHGVKSQTAGISITTGS